MELLAQPEYGFCRTLNHMWRQEGPLRKQGMVVLMTLRCVNCKGRRIDEVNLANGELVLRRYWHADGYLLKGIESNGHERPTKVDFRREMVRSMVKNRENVLVVRDMDRELMTLRSDRRDELARRRKRRRRKSA